MAGDEQEAGKLEQQIPKQPSKRKSLRSCVIGSKTSNEDKGSGSPKLAEDDVSSPRKRARVSIQNDENPQAILELAQATESEVAESPDKKPEGTTDLPEEDQAHKGRERLARKAKKPKSPKKSKRKVKVVEPGSGPESESCDEVDITDVAKRAILKSKNPIADKGFKNDARSALRLPFSEIKKLNKHQLLIEVVLRQRERSKQYKCDARTAASGTFFKDIEKLPKKELLDKMVVKTREQERKIEKCEELIKCLMDEVNDRDFDVERLELDKELEAVELNRYWDLEIQEKTKDLRRAVRLKEDAIKGLKEKLQDGRYRESQLRRQERLERERKDRFYEQCVQLKRVMGDCATCRQSKEFSKPYDDVVDPLSDDDQQNCEDPLLSDKEDQEPTVENSAPREEEQSQDYFCFDEEMAKPDPNQDEGMKKDKSPEKAKKKKCDLYLDVARYLTTVLVSGNHVKKSRERSIEWFRNKIKGALPLIKLLADAKQGAEAKCSDLKEENNELVLELDFLKRKQIGLGLPNPKGNSRDVMVKTSAYNISKREEKIAEQKAMIDDLSEDVSMLKQKLATFEKAEGTESGVSDLDTLELLESIPSEDESEPGGQESRKPSSDDKQRKEMHDRLRRLVDVVLKMKQEKIKLIEKHEIEIDNQGIKLKKETMKTEQCFKRKIADLISLNNEKMNQLRFKDSVIKTLRKTMNVSNNSPTVDAILDYRDLVEDSANQVKFYQEKCKDIETVFKTKEGLLADLNQRFDDSPESYTCKKCVKWKETSWKSSHKYDDLQLKLIRVRSFLCERNGPLINPLLLRLQASDDELKSYIGQYKTWLTKVMEKEDSLNKVLESYQDSQSLPGFNCSRCSSWEENDAKAVMEYKSLNQRFEITKQIAYRNYVPAEKTNASSQTQDGDFAQVKDLQEEAEKAKSQLNKTSDEYRSLLLSHNSEKGLTKKLQSEVTALKSKVAKLVEERLESNDDRKSLVTAVEKMQEAFVKERKRVFDQNQEQKDVIQSLKIVLQEKNEMFAKRMMWARKYVEKLTLELRVLKMNKLLLKHNAPADELLAKATTEVEDIRSRYDELKKMLAVNEHQLVKSKDENTSLNRKLSEATESLQSVKVETANKELELKEKEKKIEQLSIAVKQCTAQIESMKQTNQSRSVEPVPIVTTTRVIPRVVQVNSTNLASLAMPTAVKSVRPPFVRPLHLSQTARVIEQMPIAAKQLRTLTQIDNLKQANQPVAKEPVSITTNGGIPMVVQAVRKVPPGPPSIVIPMHLPQRAMEPMKVVRVKMDNNPKTLTINAPTSALPSHPPKPVIIAPIQNHTAVTPVEMPPKTFSSANVTIKRL